MIIQKILDYDRNYLIRFLLVSSLPLFMINFGEIKPSSAESNDTTAPVTLEADFVEIDDKNQEATFKGNVTLRQGTLEINAEQIIVKKDSKGFQNGKASGSPAHFRQKREGFSDHIDGYAERIEYDGQSGKLEMFENARITRGNDKLEGDYISYNMQTEFFQIRGKDVTQPNNTEPAGRVKAIIQPSN